MTHINLSNGVRWDVYPTGKGVMVVSSIAPVPALFGYRAIDKFLEEITPALTATGLKYEVVPDERKVILDIAGTVIHAPTDVDLAGILDGQCDTEAVIAALDSGKVSHAIFNPFHTIIYLSDNPTGGEVNANRD